MFDKKSSRWSQPPFRAGVAILIRVGREGYLACKRADGSGWQCVQGGLDDEDISLVSAAQREATEELGIRQGELRILQESRTWRRYHFPPEVRAKGGIFLGQDQKWFLGEINSLKEVNLESSCHEFSEVAIVTLEQLVDKMVEWKGCLLKDFSRELISVQDL